MVAVAVLEGAEELDEAAAIRHGEEEEEGRAWRPGGWYRIGNWGGGIDRYLDQMGRWVVWGGAVAACDRESRSVGRSVGMGVRAACVVGFTLVASCFRLNEVLHQYELKQGMISFFFFVTFWMTGWKCLGKISTQNR